MNNLYKDLEFDVILQQISDLTHFDIGEKIILESLPKQNRLSVTRELELTKEAMKLLEYAEEYDLSGVKNFSSALERAEKDLIIYGNDFLAIKNHNIICRNIRSKINKSETNPKVLKDLANTLTLIDDLEKSIDKKLNSYGDVKDNASHKLKALKEKEKSFNHRFDQVTKDFINNNRNKLVESIASERNGRVVVLLADTYRNRMNGIVHGESQSGQSVYFEPETFIKYNNERQTIQNLIQEETDKILFELSQEVKNESAILRGNLRTLGYLDAVLAKARWGFELDALIPKLSDDKSIYLKNIAHPLIPKDKVVRNTYNMVDKRILIISGPNTGGKTVTLKTIGLSVLMTLCGVPILADQAYVPLVDNIFVDLGDQQSVVDSLSTFSSHLTKLANITNNVSNNSLVLLDELGGGTDPKEGEALALAILEYLRNKDAIIVVTTHLAALKKYAQVNEDVILASVEFDEETLLPTYRFIEGLAGQSNALEIAERYGIKKEIMDQAYLNKKDLVTEEELLMQKLEKQERQLLQKESRFKEKHEELLSKEKKLKAAEKKLINSKTELLLEAEKEAQEIVDQTNKKMDQLYQEMKELHGFSKMHEAIDIKHQAKQSPIVRTQSKEPLDHKFKAGDLVKVENMNHVGEVIAVNGRNVTVDVNGLSIQTKTNKLSYEGRKEKIKKPKTKSNISVSAQKIASSELNLIGYRVAEALIELDRYIDSAVASNYPQVTIIHGMGSGQLRRAVLDALKKNKHVQEFSQAPANQGGSGATIVKLQ